jgi:hypothetical protein
MVQTNGGWRPYLYLARNLVERFFSKIKQLRQSGYGCALMSPRPSSVVCSPSSGARHLSPGFTSTPPVSGRGTPVVVGNVIGISLTARTAR